MNSSRRLNALCAVATLAATIALAGCGEKNSPEPVATGADADVASGSVAPQLGDAGIKPRPGQWQIKLQMMKFELPGMPGALKESIGKQMAQAGDVATCLTQDEVDRNDGKFFGPRDSDCDYQNFSMANGQVAAKMTCTKSGAKQTVAMHGSYGAEAYDLTLDSQSDLNGQPMTMSMHVTGHRTGECTGKEKN